MPQHPDYHYSGLSPTERVRRMRTWGDPRWFEEAMRLKTCANCGLLGQVRAADRQLLPMLEEYRQSEYRGPQWFDPLNRDYDPRPHCAASVRVFGPIADNWTMGKRGQELNLDMSHCTEFVQWVPGLSIKDHKEMLDRTRFVQFQAEQRVADRAREDADRAWRSAQDERDQRWRERMADADRKWRTAERKAENYWQGKQLTAHRWEIRALEAGIAVTAIGIVAAASLAFFRDGDGFSQTIVPGATVISTPPFPTVTPAPTDTPLPPNATATLARQ